MGGNALSEGLTERKPLAEYLEIKRRVLDVLQDEKHKSILDVVTEIVEMPEKESFGDLDVLYVCAKDKSLKDVVELIKNLFCPTELVSGTVTSFDFQNFQIDLIQSDHETIRMAKFCLSYGDRGMILGQMAKCRGFSLGTKGLIVTHSSIEKLLRTQTGLSSSDFVVLSRDPAEIRAFMGLPATDNDLLTQDSVMKFCMNSPWFKPHFFAPRRLNSCESRKKLSKRPFYRSFCEIVAEEYNLSEFMSTPDDIAADDAIQISNIQDALKKFNKEGDLEAIKARLEQQQEIKQKLSHTHFTELGFVNRHIGKARESFLLWLLKKDKNSSAKIMDDQQRRDVQNEMVLRYSAKEINNFMQQWIKQEPCSITPKDF